jgi:penicillin V acylase-like amidase (Ntn superfamily)
MPLPGNVNPRDRFQRASYYLSMVPTPKSEREGVASMLAIARNVSVPFGTPYKSFGVYNTEYCTVSDPTSQLYFFELTANPNLIWTDLKQLDFQPGAPVQTLNPDSIDLVGDVIADYRPAPAP